MSSSKAEDYKKLIVEIEFLLEQTKSVTGYFLTKTITVGEKEMETLMSGYLEMTSGSSTFFFRGKPIREIPKESHLGIEIESLTR